MSKKNKIVFFPFLQGFICCCYTAHMEKLTLITAIVIGSGLVVGCLWLLSKIWSVQKSLAKLQADLATTHPTRSEIDTIFTKAQETVAARPNTDLQMLQTEIANLKNMLSTFASSQTPQISAGGTISSPPILSTPALRQNPPPLPHSKTTTAAAPENDVKIRPKRHRRPTTEQEGEEGIAPGRKSLEEDIDLAADDPESILRTFPISKGLRQIIKIDVFEILLLL